VNLGKRPCGTLDAIDRSRKPYHSHVKVPHVAESAFSMECELTHQQDIRNDAGKITQNIFIARVRRFHVKEHVIDPNDPDVKILPEKFKVVARLGGWSYGRMSR